MEPAELLAGALKRLLKLIDAPSLGAPALGALPPRFATGFMAAEVLAKPMAPPLVSELRNEGPVVDAAGIEKLLEALGPIAAVLMFVGATRA